MKNTYFTQPVDEATNDECSFEVLAKSYRKASTHAQREGILHRVASLGQTPAHIDPKPVVQATHFLLEIGSGLNIVETSENIRILALSLFFQRILPKLQDQHKACRIFILHFLINERKAYEFLQGEPHRRNEKINIKHFLYSEWYPFMHDDEQARPELDPELIIKATFAADCCELMSDKNQHALFAIPALFTLLAKSLDRAHMKLASGFWQELKTNDDVGIIQQDIHGDVPAIEQLSKDLDTIRFLCAEVLDMTWPQTIHHQTAQVLLTLITVFEHRWKWVI